MSSYSRPLIAANSLVHAVPQRDLECYQLRGGRDSFRRSYLSRRATLLCAHEMINTLQSVVINKPVMRASNIHALLKRTDPTLRSSNYLETRPAAPIPIR